MSISTMWGRAATAALGVLIGLASPAFAKDGLTIGVAQFASSLNPNIDAVVIKSYVLDFATRPMSAFDANWQPVCLLCTELPTIDNGGAVFETTPSGGRGLAVTFTLRPGLKWGDGVPVTTKDLLFTWKLGLDPKSGFSNNHAWDRARAIDVVDERTAVLHLDRIDVAYNIWDQLLPEHLEAEAAKGTEAGDYLKATLYNRAPTTPGLYNGPYLVKSYESGAQIVLEPNPYWSGERPALRRIVVRTIENTAALEANLESGDIDMAPGDAPALTIDQVLALQKQAPNKFAFLYKPSLNYEHIDLQIDNPALADIRVRRALLHAIDRETLVRKLFEGKQPVAATWVNPLDSNFTADTATYTFDPAAARALLKEAGWTPGADGMCRNAHGEKLAFEIATTAGNKLRELTEQVLQSQWKAACIAVSIKNEPARTLFGETIKKRLYTGMAMYAWSSVVNESPRKTLHSSQIPTAANNYGGANYIAMNDAKLDADIDAADQELDPARRKALWADMQRIYTDQLRVLPLFFRAEAYVLPTWLKGFAATGHGDMSPLWAENWHAE
jgi:peptide/nickel transport system substrate-binding protein